LTCSLRVLFLAVFSSRQSRIEGVSILVYSRQPLMHFSEYTCLHCHRNWENGDAFPRKLFGQNLANMGKVWQIWAKYGQIWEKFWQKWL